MTLDDAVQKLSAAGLYAKVWKGGINGGRSISSDQPVGLIDSPFVIYPDGAKWVLAFQRQGSTEKEVQFTELSQAIHAVLATYLAS